MTPRSAKNKGKKFQNWVRDQLYKAFPSLEVDDIKSTTMGESGEDIQLSPAARKKIPYTIECKSRKSFAIYKVMKQAETHQDYTPLAVVKADRQRPLVILYAEDFFNLIKEDPD